MYTSLEEEAELRRALGAMRGAVARGLAGDLHSVADLAPGNAAKMERRRGPLAGTLFADTIAARASLSGAEGGCQAETGAAAAMAAAAGVEVLGGTPRQAVHAVSLALQGTLGLAATPTGKNLARSCIGRLRRAHGQTP